MARKPRVRPAPALGLAGVRGGHAEDVVPAALRAQLDQRMPDQSAIGQQRTVGRSQMGDDPVQQRSDHLPLPLLPRLVHRQHLPAHRQEPRVHQQPQIQHGRALVQRGRVEHEDQASIAPEGEAVADEAGPERDHEDLLVGQTAGQAAFDAGRRGGADADERLRNPRQARGARQHHTQDTEGQRFAAMPMHLRQEGPQLTRPLAPQPL